MPKDPELQISNMTGDQLEQYHQQLAIKNGEYSKLKQQLLSELTPIEQSRADKRNQIAIVNEKIRQTRVEIASCKYSLKLASNQGC